LSLENDTAGGKKIEREHWYHDTSWITRGGVQGAVSAIGKNKQKFKETTGTKKKQTGGGHAGFNQRVGPPPTLVDSWTEPKGGAKWTHTIKLEQLKAPS